MNYIEKYKEFVKEFDKLKTEHDKKVDGLFWNLIKDVEEIMLKIKDILDFYDVSGTECRLSSKTHTMFSIGDTGHKRRDCLDDIKDIFNGLNILGTKLVTPERKLEIQKESISDGLVINIFFESDQKTAINIKKRIESEFYEKLELKEFQKLGLGEFSLSYKVNILSL